MSLSFECPCPFVLDGLPLRDICGILEIWDTNFVPVMIMFRDIPNGFEDDDVWNQMMMMIEMR